jgi:HNH endonuclease
MNPRRPLTQKQKDCKLAAQNYRCAAPGCREPIGNGKRFEDDHWTPRHLDGGEELANRRLICIRCHRAKTKREQKASAKTRHIKYGRARKGPPMPGSRASKIKRHMDGTWSWR